ncbi:MAG TPA: hypothetical protein VNQ33_02055 [Acidimicrobiales bacterium]|nr:hypothetical protein [Acidimicrobiales bacterium]
MRRAGREERKRIASLVLVAVIATFSLPFGASAVTQAVDATPAQRAHVKRLHVEARPVTASRRPIVGRDATLPPTSILVAALTIVGLLAGTRFLHLVWMPGLIPVQRGPPSLR